MLNSLIIVVSILLIGRYFSERHFEEYVVKAENASASKLVDALSEEYRERGNWDLVLKEPELWFGLKTFGPIAESETEVGGKGMDDMVRRPLPQAPANYRVG